MKMWQLLKMGLMGPNEDGGSAGGDGGQVAVEGASPEAIFGGMDTAPDDPPSEAASAAEPNAAPAGDQPGAQQGQQQQVAPTQNLVAMSEQQLAALAAKMVSAVPQQAPAQQQQQAQQWTPEQQAEFDRQFNVVRVTPQIFQAITGVAPQNAEQCKALENLLHGVVRQANAMTLYQVQNQIAQREQAAMQRINPVLDHVQKQQAAELEKEFFTSYADLKDFGPLVAEVTKVAKAEGKMFTDRKQALDYVASRARSLLNKAANRSGTTPPAGRQTTQRTTMPAMSMGGRTGANNGARQPVSGPQAVFGDLDA